MKFVKTIENLANHKKALFEHDGEYFVYSYVNSQYAHETMVFRSNKAGDIENWAEVSVHPGYMSSEFVMAELEKTL